MWCDLNWIQICVDVTWEDENIQFPYGTIEMWWYEKGK